MTAKAFASRSTARRELPVPAETARGKYPVIPIVRGIQRREQHEPCFRTDSRYVCMEFECRWRKDCLHLVAEWFR